MGATAYRSIAREYVERRRRRATDDGGVGVPVMAEPIDAALVEVGG
jgi:hypothetical protein